MIVIENINKFLFEKLDALIEEGMFEDRHIILFGLNTSSYSTKNYLATKGYSIYAYVDNDERKRKDANKAIADVMSHHMNMSPKLESDFVRCYTPEELLSEYDDKAVILIASKYYNSMREQLQKLGYQEGKHIIKTVDFYGLDKVLEDQEWETNMQRLGDAEVRNIQIEIMEHVKEMCRENNLRYFISGGTLIGAVRHGGYIPWDDDIDFVMPIPDYKKLIELFEDDERYEVLTIYNHPDDYFNFFTRIIDKTTVMKTWEYPFLMTSGVNVDLFPLMGLPDSAYERIQFYDKIRELNTQFISTFIEYNIDQNAVLEQRAYLRDTIIAMMEQYNYDESEYIGYIISKYREKEIMPRSIYEGSVELPFENTMFHAAVGYKEYLKILFGDYMKLPPEKERYSQHNFVAYKK